MLQRDPGPPRSGVAFSVSSGTLDAQVAIYRRSSEYQNATLDHPLGEELPFESLEAWVFAMTQGAFKSRELLEAERPEGVPPFDEDRALLQNWTTLVNRQGKILAHLSVVPSTRAELMESMPGMVNRAPAWLDAHLQGNQPMTWELFFRGLAQTVRVQRREIERVVAEQVSDREEIEQALAEAPVPAGTEAEERSDLMSGVVRAMSAHLKALVDIAYDLEVQAGRRGGTAENS